MGRLILTLFIGFLCFTYQAKIQWAIIDPSNLVRNIKSVVQSSTTTTNMVKSLQESIKIYNRSKAYHDALKSAHNTIRDAQKMRLALEMVSEITEIYILGFSRMVSDPNFTANELAAVSAGYAQSLKKGGALVAELKTVITSDNGLSLLGKERMDVVDQVYTKMLEYCSLTRCYTRRTISTSFICNRERGDAYRVLALYRNPDGKYW